MRLTGLRRLVGPGVLGVALAVLVHQFTLWALPRWIMHRTIQAITGGPGTAPQGSTLNACTASISGKAMRSRH